jgi:hypothetical protein
MIVSIMAIVIDYCTEVIIAKPVMRSHHLVRKIPSYFQSNQEARPASTYPRCRQSHAKQMGIDAGEDSMWMMRSEQSPDPIVGQLCSHLPTLSYLRNTNSSKKAMCWISSTMMMTSNDQRIHLIIGHDSVDYLPLFQAKLRMLWFLAQPTTTSTS